MAKAQFHKNQRVYVKPVGTWALIERVLPVWVKGLDEPMRINYDVGLGRDFAASELTAEDVDRPSSVELGEFIESWRVLRQKNRWATQGEDQNHPFPGTFPIVVTDENDWGGWRVPGAEYDRNPEKIEYQARLISNAPHMLRLIRRLVDYVSENPENASGETKKLARAAVLILRDVHDVENDTQLLEESHSAA